MSPKKRSNRIWIIASLALVVAVVLFFILFIILPPSRQLLSEHPAPTNTLIQAAVAATVFSPTLHASTDTPVVIPPTHLPPSLSPGSTPSLTPQPHLPATPATPTPKIYTIQAGDSLTSIAIQFGVPVEALRAANQLSNDSIYAGNTLVIPAEDEAFTTLTPSTPITSTILLTGGEEMHRVQPGETIETIASQYGLITSTLRALNFMAGDALLPGQTIWISRSLDSKPTAYSFSTLNKDLLASAYPLSIDGERFSLHYAPDTYPDADPQAVALLVDQALSHIETLFGVPLDHHVDVYAAGSLFENPDQVLRGSSYSVNWKTLFLQDGTGNAADQQYIVAHELTHVYTWNVFGPASSPLLSEGTAVYSGMQLIKVSNHMPIKTFCAAYLQAGQLPSVSASLNFNGHILYLANYYAAGCFVGYLLETYGTDRFGLLYPTNNFENVYGKTVWALEQEWRASLSNISVSFQPEDLISAVDAVQNAYANFLPTFTGTPAQRNAYYQLDLARLALLEGRFLDVTRNLEAYRKALK